MRALGSGLFVTGTDTGVGKTEIACGLLRGLARQGRLVVGMKPVAAGARSAAGVLRNADVEALRGAGTLHAARSLINPYLFAPPIAPHLAAREAGVSLQMEVIIRAYRRLAGRADVVVVEGVGGFRVPLDERFDTGDLAERLRLPVVLVVGMRLGCLSHALLTAEAIAHRGLELSGWVANRIDPAMRRYRGNVCALRERLRAPLLGEIPFLPHKHSRRAAVDRFLSLGPLIAQTQALAESTRMFLHSA